MRSGRLKQDIYSGPLRDIIFECFRRMGKRFDRCEQCAVKTAKLSIHHTKYKGATVYDLQLVCHKCNMAPKNKGLA